MPASTKVKIQSAVLAPSVALASNPFLGQGSPLGNRLKKVAHFEGWFKQLAINEL